jgi:CubicO group peptidase (beta-lactamase class C family)
MIRTVVVCLALCAAVVAAAAAALAAGGDASPPTVTAFERAWHAWARKHGLQRGTLAVAHGDRLAVVSGYGNRKGEERVLLASLSKAITGVCVATLVQGGRLTWTTPLGEVLDRGEIRDARLHEVTIEQLLTHRAGFGDGRGGDPSTGETLRSLLLQRGPDQASPRDVWRLVARFKLQDEPGAVYTYTNAAYFALTLVIERVTGRSYEDYCGTAVLVPTGVHAAALDPTWKVLSGVGGWKLSGPEYLAFLRVFAPGGPVLTDESRRFVETTTPGRAVDASGQVFYTLGVTVRPVSGGYNLFHAGRWGYRLSGAPGGPLEANIGTWAVRAAAGASWFASFEPMVDTGVRNELDRELFRVARAVRDWPPEDLFPRFGIR